MPPLAAAAPPAVQPEAGGKLSRRAPAALGKLWRDYTSKPRALLRRLTGFAWSFFVFLLFQFVMTVAARFEWLPDELIAKNSSDQIQTACLLVSVYLLVTFNTILFILDAVPEIGGLSRLDGLTDASRAKIRRQLKSFVVGLIASVLISGILAASLGWNLFTDCPSTGWDTMVMFNEGLAILLFAAFLFADLCCARACETALKSDLIDTQRRQTLQQFLTKVKLYARACDGPGLIGIVLITFLASMWHPLVAGYYWRGFVAGAIGVHIAFSQGALALLSAEDGK